MFPNMIPERRNSKENEGGGENSFGQLWYGNMYNLMCCGRLITTNQKWNNCGFVSSEWCSYQHFRRFISWENSYHHRTYRGHLPSFLHDRTKVWGGTAKQICNKQTTNISSIKFCCFTQEFKQDSFFKFWRTLNAPFSQSCKKKQKNLSNKVGVLTVYAEKHIFEFSLRILQQQWQTATWQASHLWLFAWFSQGASVAHWLAKEAQRSKRSERYFPFIFSSKELFFCTQTGTENPLPGAPTPQVSNTPVKLFLFVSALKCVYFFGCCSWKSHWLCL